MSDMAFDRQDASKQTRTFSRRLDVNEYLSQRLGEPFREYRQLLEKAVRFEVELPFPIHVDFEIAFLCNLACVMCTHAADAPVGIKPRRPDFMDFNVFKKVVDEGVAHTLRSVGLDQEGEAFLVKKLPDFIEYARSKGIVDIFFNTNATLMTKEKADMILNSGLTRIHFSLDAMTENTYKKVRVGGHFEVVMRNILSFLERKKELRRELPVTRASFVKMKSNEHELEDFVRFWQDKVDYIAVQEYNSPFPQNVSYSELAADGRDVNANFRCTQPWFRMVILSDGSIMPCCLLGYSKRLTTGNAVTESVYDVWNAPRVKALRKIHKDGEYWKNPVCRLCASNFLPKGKVHGPGDDPIQMTFPHLHDKS